MPGSDLLNSFSAYLLDECGFSPVTVQGRRDCLQPFFCWLEQRKRPVSAVNARDIPVIQFIVLVLAAFYVVMNIVTDVIALMATPRRRIAR